MSNVKNHPISYEQLIAYLGNELDAADSAIVKAHLAACSECAAAITRLRIIRSLLRADDHDLPPASAVRRAKAIFKTSLARGATEQSLFGQILQFWFTRALSFSSPLVAIIVAFTLLFGGMTVVTVAAQSALPGDALYPVKTVVENVQIAIAPDNPHKAQLHLVLAQTRVNEIAALIAQGRYAPIPETVIAFEAHIAATTLDLRAVAREDAARGVVLVRETDRLLSNYTGVLTTLRQASPHTVQLSINHAIDISEAGKAAAWGELPPTIVAALVTSTPTVTALPTETAEASPTSLATDTPVPDTSTPTEVIPPTDRVEPTATLQPTPVPSSTATHTPPNPTNTPSVQPTRQPTNTALPGPTDTQAPAAPTTQPTATSTPVDEPAESPTTTSTNTPQPSDTPEPTQTLTQTPEPTQTSTQTSEPTQRSTRKPKRTKTATPTRTPEPTDTLTSTPSSTDTSEVEETSSPTATPSKIPVESITPTFTPTLTHAPSLTASHTAAPTETPSPTPTDAALPDESLTATYTAPLEFSSSLQFDGVRTFVTTGNLPLLGEYTIEAWLKPGVDSDGRQVILSDAEGLEQATFALYIDGAGEDCGGARYQFAFYQAGDTAVQCSRVPIRTGLWYHIAVVRESSGQRTFFVNGVAQSSQAETGALSNISGALVFGKGSIDAEYFGGLIDEVRISRTAIYTSRFSPPIAPLLNETDTMALWHLDEGEGQTIFDSSGNGRHGSLGFTLQPDPADPVWAAESPIEK
ncbi:MAG TPA: LamG-like jellyroll fold domain-containing protein [Anaerolineae bacterium]|nr:LamG-like jellyroll fold domain-containing protein [Anaerolineae bacterium]